MKKIFLAYLFPFFLVLTFSLYFSKSDLFNHFLFSSFSASQKTSVDSLRYINNFNGDTALENLFLSKNKQSSTGGENIFLLGSSELAENTPAIPYNFIPEKFNTNVIGTGHAGNQCFSMFCQLLANPEKLNNANIVIIISPGWFESKPSKGTPSDIFLEYNSERFLKSILTDTSNAEFQNYACKRITDFYRELNSPSVPLRLMYLQGQSNKSFIHKIFCYPLIEADKFLLEQKNKLTNNREHVSSSPIGSATNKKVKTVNWDSLFLSGRSEADRRATNNNMGIENEYYTTYIHGKSGKIQPVDEAFNQELADFKMLVKLIKKNNVKAGFIIQPFNALYFKNIKALSPVLDIIENEINKNDFPLLNLCTTDSAEYEKEILRDVMHLSDYGWYKVDKFIIETYNINK